MPENKTKKNNLSVSAFLETVKDKDRRKDCDTMLKLMKEMTGEKPKMWGTSMVGFGEYHYKYDSGHEGDYFKTGFSPRKQSITLYIMPGFEKYPELMDKLGKHKVGKSCLYINSLDDIHIPTLKKLVKQSYQYMTKSCK
ncbi:MAG: DUF1801 domain-containing protein [candidate division Zixibacteria bacterium]|nr:DUF1801 domain-containing protein [candidate division Zixibacteria bacterium]